MFLHLLITPTPNSNLKKRVWLMRLAMVIVETLNLQKLYLENMASKKSIMAFKLQLHVYLDIGSLFIMQVVDVQQQIRRRRVKKKYTVPNDPRWSDQWSLVNEYRLHTYTAKYCNRFCCVFMLLTIKE